MKGDEVGLKERMRLKAMVHQEEMILLYRELDAVNARLRADLLAEVYGPGEMLDAVEQDIQRTMKRDDIPSLYPPSQFDV